MTKYDNTASVGITFVDKLHNIDLKKCGKSSRRQKALFGDHKQYYELTVALACGNAVSDFSNSDICPCGAIT